MLNGITKLGGLWASARLRFRDLPASELSAAWAKIVGTAVEGEIRSNKSWVQELKRQSAPSGQILEIEEHLELLGKVGLELDIDCQL